MPIHLVQERWWVQALCKTDPETQVCRRHGELVYTFCINCGVPICSGCKEEPERETRITSLRIRAQEELLKQKNGTITKRCSSPRVASTKSEISRGAFHEAPPVFTDTHTDKSIRVTTNTYAQTHSPHATHASRFSLAPLGYGACSCVKVALDFVSPESAQQACVELPREFRRGAHPDKCQGKMMLIHATQQAFADLEAVGRLP